MLKIPKGDGKYKDIILFGRVISAGLVVAGYVFAGVFIARWLERNGYPSLLVTLTPPGAAFFGLWQGWLFIASAVRSNKK